MLKILTVLLHLLTMTEESVKEEWPILFAFSLFYSSLITSATIPITGGIVDKAFKETRTAVSEKPEMLSVTANLYEVDFFT